MTGLVVRELREADVEGATALGQRCFVGTERPEFAYELVRPISRAWVAVEERAVLGYALGWGVAGWAELMSIAVEPGRRSHGMRGGRPARPVEGMVEENVDQIVLEVRAGNAAARTLYEAFGFESQGTRKGYYADGEDGVLYRRKLL